MNRRNLLVATALAMAPLSARAQDDIDEAAVAEAWATMLATQDPTGWLPYIADDYSPLYPQESQLPGKAAYEQRIASWQPWPFDEVTSTVVSVARQDDMIFTLVEISGRGGNSSQGYSDVKFPDHSVFKVRDGLIVGAGGLSDLDLMFEQLTDE